MTQQEVMKAFMHSLDETEMSGRAAMDEAVRASSNFKSFQEVADNFKKDANSAGNWNTFLQKYCGIIIDNNDVGAITGSDTGGSTEKGPEDVLPAEGEAAYPEGSSFTVKGLTIYGIPPRETLTEAQQLIVRGLYSWWIRDALEHIEEATGLSYNEADTTHSRLRLKFFDDETAAMMAYVQYNPSDESLKEWESMILGINMAKFKDLTADNRHGYTQNGYLDRILAHELTHGVMASNINYFVDLPDALSEGGTAEIIRGIDDSRKLELIYCAQHIDEVTSIINMNYVENNKSGLIAYAGGYIFMRYFLKQAAEDTTFDYDTYRAKINLGSGGKFANNYFDDVTIKGGNGADTVSNSGNEVSISGGNGNDALNNYGNAVTIKGGAGNDSVLNGTGMGDDAEFAVVYGEAGNDTLNNHGANSTLYGGKGSDVMSNYYKGESAYLFGDADNDSMNNYGAGATLDGGKGVDSITNYAANSVIDGGADNDIIINASNETIVVAINMNEGIGTETISGDDSTIYGGAGNDSITNNCARVIIYGDAGNDTIENYGMAEIHGGAGNDVFYNLNETFSNEAAAMIYGDAGKDYFFNNADSTTMLGGADNDTFSNFGDGALVSGDAGNDSIYSAGIYVTITGGDGSDKVINEGSRSRVSLGAGNDSLMNTGDHVTISGGAGNDTITNSGKHIVYQLDGGKDIIFGANDGDTIQLDTENYSTRVSGSDFVVSASGSTFTFKDAASFTFNIETGSSSDVITASAGLSYNGTKSLLTASKNFTGENISLAQNVQKVTANNVTSGVNLVGNGLNNSIRGGKGDDTLYGGAGNDTLTGGSGADIFVYDSGNDVITDYRAGVDKIKIDSEITGASVSGSNVIFETDGGTLTVQNAKNKKLTVINEPWFMESTFTAAQLDSIIESKVAVTSFETASENLAQKEQIIVCAEKN